MNLASTLTTTAASTPDRIAIRTPDRSLSFRLLDGISARVATLITEHRVGPGDPVAMMMPNVAEFAAVYYGILRTGALVVPLNPWLRASDAAYYLRDCGARLLIAWHEQASGAAAAAAAVGAEIITIDPAVLADRLADLAPSEDVVTTADDATAVIVYTAGTSGAPKGAELTHANLRTNAEVITRSLIFLNRDDVLFGAQPLFHSFGQTLALNSCITVGATLVLTPRFDPVAALALIARERATVFTGAPAMFESLLEATGGRSVDLSSLRVCVSGGDALPPEVGRAFEQRFHTVILQGYGLAETSPAASFHHPHLERRPGSIGSPIQGVQLRVVDDEGDEVPRGEVGEIQIKGHNVMKRYWNRPEATAAALTRDGWLATGDLGRADDDGYYYMLDRARDLIIRGGYNVYPHQIEEVLHEHPDVAEVAVLGLPDERLGEEVGAAIVLHPGARTTPVQLQNYVKKQVPANMYPRQIWLTTALPKGPTGKVLKRSIEVPTSRVIQ